MTIEQPEFIRPAGVIARTPADRIIVSCGIGPFYRARLRSTVNHCAVHCPETWRLFYDDYPIGCPPHHEQQYAFKIYALARAIAAGFQFVLWMDTSFQPIASIEQVWQIIQTDGWFIAKQGDAQLGNWCSDAMLSAVSMTRDKAMEIPLCYSGMVGLDVKREPGATIWKLWREHQLAGRFNGPHFNAQNRVLHQDGLKTRGWCSDDPRCEGHRHDEASLSIVLDQLGLRPMTTGLLTLESPDGIIGHCVPDYDVVKMREYINGHGLLGWEEAADACGDIAYR